MWVVASDLRNYFCHILSMMVSVMYVFCGDEEEEEEEINGNDTSVGQLVAVINRCRTTLAQPPATHFYYTYQLKAGAVIS